MDPGVQFLVQVKPTEKIYHLICQVPYYDFSFQQVAYVSCPWVWFDVVTYLVCLIGFHSYIQTLPRCKRIQAHQNIPGIRLEQNNVSSPHKFQNYSNVYVRVVCV